MPITRLIQLPATFLLLSCLAFAQSKSAKDYANSAKKHFKARNYQEAVQDYGRALAAETNAKRLEDYRKELLKSKQHLYRQLVDDAAARSSRQAKIDMLSQARQLGIEHTEGKLGGRFVFGGKDFREIVSEGRKARQQLIAEIGKDLQQEVDQKNFSVALSFYEDAEKLDSELSQDLAELKNQVDRQMNHGRQLARDAWQALQAKQHELANQRFQEAEQVYPGQERVQEGLRQIQKDVSEYQRRKSRADQLNQANQIEAVDAYRAALDVHPDMGKADNLSDRIRDLEFRHKRALAWDAYNKGDYIRSQQDFETLRHLDPNDEDARSGYQKSRSMLKFLEGKRHWEDGQYQTARRILDEAVGLDGDNVKARKLLSEDDQYRKQVKEGRRLFSKSQKDRNPQDCQRAIQHFLQARGLNRSRFENDGLAGMVDGGDCQSVIPLPYDMLSAGLDSYLAGQPPEAIGHLKEALDYIGDGRVEIHALLGAAYCFSGLFQGTEDSERLEMGREQFRLALQADPEYRLNESLFSPRIRRIFEQVRAELQAAEPDPSQAEAVPPENQ